jgi:hypothetical protein
MPSGKKKVKSDQLWKVTVELAEEANKLMEEGRRVYVRGEYVIAPIVIEDNMLRIACFFGGTIIMRNLNENMFDPSVLCPITLG